MAQTVIINGVEELRSKINELGNDMKGLLGKIALAGAFVLEADVKRDMATGKSGRQYKRGEKMHTASGEGESPAVDTGALLNSIISELGEVTDTSGTALVGTNMEYAVFLEEGTSKMAARPFMRPGAERSKAAIEEAMQAVAREILNNAGR